MPDPPPPGVDILVKGVILGPKPKSQLKNQNQKKQNGGVILGPEKGYFLGPFAKKGIFGPQRAKMIPSMSMSHNMTPL